MNQNYILGLLTTFWLSSFALPANFSTLASLGNNSYAFTETIKLQSVSKSKLLWSKSKPFSPTELWNVLDWQKMGGTWWEVNLSLKKQIGVPSQAQQAWVIPHIGELAYVYNANDSHYIVRKAYAPQTSPIPNRKTMQSQWNEYGTLNCWEKVCQHHHLYESKIKVTSDGKGKVQFVIKGDSLNNSLTLTDWSKWSLQEKKQWSLILADYLSSEFSRLLPSILESIPGSFNAQNWSFIQHKKGFDVLKENLMEKLDSLQPKAELKIYQVQGENYKLEFFGNLSSKYRLVIE